MRVVLLLALSTLGCAQPVPAPKDVDGLARFLYDRFDPKDEDPAISDVELADAATKLRAALGELKGAADAPKSETLGNLTQAELDAVGLSAMDPSVPQGMFIADVVHCTLAQLQKIVLNPDQLSLYPEAYATYQRTFDKDRPATLPTWQVTYKSSENPLITNQFTATEHSGLRTVPGDSPVMMTRVFMPAPAVFEDPNEQVQYTHDFQIELYQEQKPGELAHFYGMWRFMHLGALGDSYGGLFIDQTTSGMLDWDKKTDALCAQP